MSRSAIVGVGSGVLLAIVTSGGIVGERISGGDVRVALLVNALITVVSLIVLRVTTKQVRPSAAFGFAQVGGAILGIALVHLFVRLELVASVPWLSERPAQLVNDVIAAGTVLALIWACAHGLDARVLAGALVIVTIYRLTGAAWHVDHAPEGFRLTVQQLVVFQFAASALGLLAFSHLRNRLRGDSS